MGMGRGVRPAGKPARFIRVFAAAALAAGLFPQALAFADDGASVPGRARLLEGKNATASPSANVANLPRGATQGWWRRVQRALAEGEYRPSDSQHGLQAPNRAHNLRIYFEATGIRVRDRTATGGPDLLRLSLHGMGRGGALTPIGAGEVTRSGARIEIQRPTITEWYDNTSAGLEQGFTLRGRPSGKGRLVLELAVERARASLRGDSIELATDAGRRLRYSKLVAIDATGRILVSRLEVASPSRLRLVVDDGVAQYPLTIDPLITGVFDTRLESNPPDPVGFNPAAFGGSVSAAGDVNGDGFADVIVSAPGWDGGDPHEGAAFVFLGSAAGVVGSDPTTAHARIESNQFGAQLSGGAGAGDVNGDGFDDIVVGAHNYDDTIANGTLRVDGAAFVFLGSATGIVGSGPATAHAWIRPNQLQSELGLSVAGVGDINGDGYDDIAVGVPKQGIPFPPNIPPNDNSGDGGAVLIFLGGAAGITGTGFDDADTVLLPYLPGFPEASQSFMGSSVSGAGDVNGDGFADIVTHAAGEAVVFLGSAAGIVGADPTSAHARIASDQPGAAFASSVSGAGDVNGDGFDDIIVGAPFYPILNSTTEEGAAFVFLGSLNGILATNNLDAQAAFFGSELAEWLGASVSGVGDVDGDGFDDIAIAARIYPGSLDNEGVAYVFRGGPSGIVGTSLLDAFVRLESGQAGAANLGNQAAFDVSGAGDINRDGFADVIVGMGFYDAGEENEGAAFVYHGGSSGVPTNQPPVANAGPDQVVLDADLSGFELVTVDGSASSDAEGPIPAFEWHEGTTLLGNTALVTTALGLGQHLLTLTVTDGDGISRSDAALISAQAPAPPPTPTPANFTLKTFALAGSVLSVEIKDADAGVMVTIDGVGRGDTDGKGRYKSQISGFSSPTCVVTVQVGTSSTQATPTGCVPSSPPPPGPNTPPVAAAAATPSSGEAPLTVAFSSAGSSDPDGASIAFVWDFGDGATSAQANPTHAYGGAGEFTVVLTVTDNDGATDTAAVTVMVTPPPGPILSSVTFSPAIVTGGSSATGEITFDRVTDGAVVSLGSSSDVVTVPQTTVVSGGQSSGVFPVTTTSVASAIEVTITATAFGVTRTGTLTVSPQDPPPADTVRIERAEFKRGNLAGVLQVRATSTNPSAIMTVYFDASFLFTLTNLGGGKFQGEFGSRFGFERITVRSNFGGFATVDVVEK